LKEALKKSNQDSHMLHVSGSGDGVSFEPKVSDESENKTTGISKDDDSNDDDSDKVSKDDDDDDDVDRDADGDNDAIKIVKGFIQMKRGILILICKMMKNKNHKMIKEYDELYRDVNVRSKDANHEKKGKGDTEMIDASREDVSQEKSYEQVIDDAHVTVTAI
ncbi:hypothetical protein Tco_0234880, partial [Tanacetum coccineum]